jgi:hypothetical protein
VRLLRTRHQLNSSEFEMQELFLAVKRIFFVRRSRYHGSDAGAWDSWRFLQFGQKPWCFNKCGHPSGPFVADRSERQSGELPRKVWNLNRTTTCDSMTSVPMRNVPGRRM